MARIQPFARAARLTLFSVAVLASACAESALAPTAETSPVLDPELVANSWVADVDRAGATVMIRSGGLPGQASLYLGDYFGLQPTTPQLSLLGDDVVQIEAANLAISDVGQFIPGKVRVTFDVRVHNRLGGVALVTPTFPAPPAGSQGILLIPFDNAVITTHGAVTTTSGGVSVELPSSGGVVPSVDFDGRPHDFFNDGGCGPDDDDCSRFEAFPAPLGPGAVTPFRTIGFDVDASAIQFRSRMILAGDLRS